jgi:hypothetical protein
MVCNDTKQPQISVTCTEVELRYSHERRSLCIEKFVSQMIFSRGVPVQSEEPVPLPVCQPLRVV